DCDIDGIEDGEETTVLRIADCNETLSCGQARPRSIDRKVSVEFSDNVTLAARQKSRFYVQGTVRCFHSENFRARNFPLALQTKHFLQCVDTVAQAQQPFDIAATKQERPFSLHPVLRPTWRFRRRGRLRQAPDRAGKFSRRFRLST